MSSAAHPQAHPGGEAASEGTAGREGVLPEFSMLWRGAAFACAALVALRMARFVARGPVIVSLPGALLFGGVAILAAWAAAIHLSGGEKFDDHDCV